MSARRRWPENNAVPDVKIPAGKRVAVIADMLKYAECDTLCYFADYPESLIRMQREKWQPVLNWINGCGCSFQATQGLEVCPLTPQTAEYIKGRLNLLDDESLQAFRNVAGGCRSVILAMAVLEGRLEAQEAFDLAVLEETFQNEMWLKDEEAHKAEENRRREVIEAAQKLKGNKHG